MLAKLEITGTVEVVTGMHIGGNSSFSAIGAVDSPVVKDTLDGSPIIPGSTLKGKMRTLLAKAYKDTVAKTPNEDAECIRSLFGSSEKGKIKPSRLLFSDMRMSNWEELKKKGLTSMTEVKFENNINRATAMATPRQIERVVRGAKFPLSLVYEVPVKEDESIDIEQMQEDFRLISDGFKYLHYDYLGGHGSRGYGKVVFSGLNVKCVVGKVEEDYLTSFNKLLKGVVGKVEEVHLASCNTLLKE